jgi:hypothetical protein
MASPRRMLTTLESDQLAPVRVQQRGWPRACPGQLRQLYRYRQMAVIAIATEATLRGG